MDFNALAPLKSLSLLAVLFLSFSILFFSAYIFLYQPAASACAQSGLSVVISPNSDAEILDAMSSAKERIWLEMYLFTSTEIADKLVEMKKKGIDVKVLLEKRVEGGANMKMCDYLERGGVDVRWASATEFQLTHSKLIIVDGRAFVGSINLSPSALKKNREIDVLIADEKIVRELTDIFISDWEKGA